MPVPSLLICLLPTLLSYAFAFDIRQVGQSSVNNNVKTSPSSLSYRDDKDAYGATGIVTEDSFVLPFFLRDLEAAHREHLKQELAMVSIENYDYDVADTNTNTYTRTPEDIMKEMERVNPWSNPAHNPELNARWSFVFTGVPTIGMRLITLLSRLSVGLPVLDFRDVYLEVRNQSTQVKASVSCRILNVPLCLEVYTNLEPQLDDPKGTFLTETFDKLVVMGVEIPTPQEWKTSRSLEISYLDQDMMIARTAGGEPHLLLRHSSCSTDIHEDNVEECDIEAEITQTAYLRQAQAKYGSTLTRSLVDRDYGDKEGEFNLDDVVRLIQGILQSESGH